MVTMMERTVHKEYSPLERRRIFLNLATSVKPETIVKWINRHETFDPYFGFNYDGKSLPCNRRYLREYLSLFVQMGNKYGIHAYTPGVPHSQCTVIYCSRYAWAKWKRIMPGWIDEQEIKPDHPALANEFEREYSPTMIR